MIPACPKTSTNIHLAWPFAFGLAFAFDLAFGFPKGVTRSWTFLTAFSDNLRASFQGTPQDHASAAASNATSREAFAVYLSAFLRSSGPRPSLRIKTAPALKLDHGTMGKLADVLFCVYPVTTGSWILYLDPRNDKTLAWGSKDWTCASPAPPRLGQWHPPEGAPGKEFGQVAIGFFCLSRQLLKSLNIHPSHADTSNNGAHCKAPSAQQLK